MINFSELPVPVKKGFLSLWIGWLIHFYLVFILFGDDQKILLQQIAIVAFVFYFVCVKLRNWARKLCLMANLMTVVYYAFFSIILFNQQKMWEAGMFALNTGIFLFSTWYLFNRRTGDFFKQQMDAEQGNSDSN